ncbi:YwbE family protein [Marinigracilibium pacificum]|uniref:YwbE family protein n=1 Tax=Marinigracilibium pacificum TaxID=2729599 RepID=A0A848IUF7_9BACT|nr:YwbE family protein [Marinigracilibium pacificum]NMM47346.1 YwbE family protein [Marinigracilibium pacificum]
MNEGKARRNIFIGQNVRVVQKHHQRTGELTEGIVKKILTKSNSHPWGIKVMLEDGIVGRVKELIDKPNN